VNNSRNLLKGEGNGAGRFEERIPAADHACGSLLNWVYREDPKDSNSVKSKKGLETEGRGSCGMLRKMVNLVGFVESGVC